MIDHHREHVRSVLKITHTHPFDQWCGAVDAIVQELLDVALADLPDLNLRDAYDAGTTAASFVHNELRAALLAAGLPAFDADELTTLIENRP